MLQCKVNGVPARDEEWQVGGVGEGSVKKEYVHCLCLYVHRLVWK